MTGGTAATERMLSWAIGREEMHNLEEATQRIGAQQTMGDAYAKYFATFLPSQPTPFGQMRLSPRPLPLSLTAHSRCACLPSDSLRPHRGIRASRRLHRGRFCMSAYQTEAVSASPPLHLAPRQAQGSSVSEGGLNWNIKAYVHAEHHAGVLEICRDVCESVE